MASSPVAEAFVLVRPDLTGFAAQLQSELAKQLGKVREPTINVRARVVGQVQAATKDIAASAAAEAKAVGATGFAALSAAQDKARAAAIAIQAQRAEAQAAREAATAAAAKAGALAGARLSALADLQIQKQAAKAAVEAAAAASAEASARRQLAVVTTAQTRAEQRFIAIQTAGIAAVSAVGAAQERVVAAKAALVAADNLVNAAQAKGIPTAIALGEAYQAEATAALNAAEAQLANARATQTAAARSSQAARGAFATAAQFAGLRGAVLAATGPFLAATVAVTALGKAISSGAQLQQSLNLFQETAGATAAEMRDVSAAAIALGKDVSLPGVSAGDAALTMNELAKAGLSVKDSVEGARGVLLLATAANIEFSQASELAASALNSFGLAGSQAGRVADVFAGAAKAAQGSIQDFALANQQVDAVARQVGLSLEDTTALLAELAKNGLRGSDAGTSLRTALIRLVSPTQEARQLLDQLGVSIRDAQGNIDPLVFARFGEAVSGLAPDLRDAITASIFGQDAIRAVAIAAREGADGFEKMREQVSKTGTAQALADAQSKGLIGRTQALASNLETLGGTFSQLIIPALEKFVSTASEMVSGLNSLVEGFNSLAGAIGNVVQAVPGLDKIPSVLTKIAKYTGPQGLFFGIAAGVDAFTTSSEEAAAAAEKLQAAIAANAQAQADFSGVGQLEALGRVQQEQLEARNKKILELVGQLNTTLTQFANSGIASDAVRDSVFSIIDQLKSIGGPAVQEALRQNGQDITNIVVSELQDLSQQFGVTLEDLNNSVPQTLKNVINKLAGTDTGRAALRKFGQQLSDSLAEGINDNADKAVDAARDAVERAAKAVQDAERGVKDAVARAGQDLINSVTQARSNLRSVGDQLAQDVGNLIEVGPLAQKAKALKAELDKIDARLEAFRRNRQRDSLESALTGAQADLQRQRDQIVTLGRGLTAAQRSKISELLAPAQDKVKQATDDIKEFRLEGQRDLVSGRIEVISQQVQDRADKAGKAIQTLVQQLQNGKIDADKFGTSLQTLLNPQLQTLKSTAGKNLGLRFSTEFLNNIQTVVKQAQALAGFVSTPSASPVVNPAATQAAGRQSVADARGRETEQQQALKDAQANLDRTIRENADNQKKTATNTARTVALLEQINKALGPSEKPGTTRAGGPKPDNNKSVPGRKVGGR